MRILSRSLAAFVALLGLGGPAWAGFPSVETYLPAVGRVSGQGGAQFYTTIWATNLSGVAVSFRFDFLKQGQANPSPASFSDSLAPGQTKVYENVVESRLGLSGQLGAARITASGEILVSERIYNLAPGDDLGKSEGLFFAGVPKSFSISLGQSASIQGINQGGSENFRYNFALVETGGGNPTVNVQLFDAGGTLQGQRAYALQPYEQIQPNVTDLLSTVSTINARITATVTGGSGSVLIAGAQLANLSQDSSGFEMSFRDSLLGGGTGVTSLNGLTGALSIAAGNGISITPSGPTLTIAATGSGGSGGLTLPYTGESDTGNAFQVLNNGASGAAVSGSSTGGASGLNGFSATGYGVRGSSNTGIGVIGLSAAGNTNTAVGVYGTNSNAGGAGVGGANGSTGNLGFLGGPTYGVAGVSANAAQAAVYGTTSSGGGWGVQGNDSASGNNGYLGGPDYGVFGLSAASYGVVGKTSTNTGGVWGHNNTSGNDGYLGGPDYGVYGIGSSAASTGSETNGTASTPPERRAPMRRQGRARPEMACRGTGVIGVYAQGPWRHRGRLQGRRPVNGHVATRAASVTFESTIRRSVPQHVTHSFVGSSEMKNIYDGVAMLGPSGTATVPLPDWFETLNRDFRYQLTAIGTPQAGLFVSREVAHHEFTVAGGVPGARVSWQVTGVRHDPWANAHPIQARQAKSDSDRGFYIVPELYGQPKTKSADPIQRKEALEAEREGNSNER